MAKKDYSEFEDMSLNPFAVPAGLAMDHYRIFKAKSFWVRKFDNTDYEDTFSNADVDEIIRYAVLLVDPESPMYDERNFELRMERCRRILDIDPKSHVWKEIKEDGELVTNIIYEFFKRINSHVYETWFSMKMNIHELNSYLRKKLSTDRNGNVAQDVNARRQLSQVITELTFELVEMEYQLFPDDRLLKMINERSSDDGLGGYAEEHAEEPRYNK